MNAAEQEVFRELRRERLWQFAERIGLWAIGAAVGIFVFGLVSAATIVWVDASEGSGGASFAVSDDE